MSSILIVLGIFLVVCLIRYPSYTTEENLRRDRRLRKGNRSNSSTTVVTIQGRRNISLLCSHPFCSNIIYSIRLYGKP